MFKLRPLLPYLKPVYLSRCPKSTAPKLDEKPNSIVAAAFASLKPHQEWGGISTPKTDAKIDSARSIDELLSISGGSGISRRHAFKVVSTLAEWSSTGKAKVSDFENDARFIKLCKVLSKGAKVSRNMEARSEDLNTVLSVTADEEAARLLGGLSLPQMVKVMSTLALRKRRSIVLLRTLAYNIAGSGMQLNLKESADLLYSVSNLSFIDENLLSKICSDVDVELRKEVTKSAVIGSILTSLGLLRYKNPEILDALSEWVAANYKICRSQDIFSLFMTLAMVNYRPSNADELFKLVPELSQFEVQKPQQWLNFVWSLTILGEAGPAQISTVFNEEFMGKIRDDLTVPAKIKLLNIQNASQLLLNHPVADFSISVDIAKTKEKAEMVRSISETLKNLISGDNFTENVNTNMGFTIDIEAMLDKKLLTNEKDKVKVAILAYDYRDMCLGKVEPSGANVLAEKLLEARGYKVVTVPYTDFKSSDKVVQRVRYLENKLKSVVK